MEKKPHNLNLIDTVSGLLQQAIGDFQEAVKRDPNNSEFQEGLKVCRAEMDTGWCKSSPLLQ